MNTVIEVQNLRAQYGDTVVLHNVSTTIYESEIKVILGTSGCGKTTFLKNTIGLIQPASGTVRIFGKEMGELDEKPTEKILRNIGMMYQYGALLGSLRVCDNVALPLRMHTRLPEAVISEIVRVKLEQVSLGRAYNLFPDELSGGMRKRVAIARALVMDPPILFCDEPSAGLDPVTARGLDELLLQMKEELQITIVVITHETESIRRIADSILFLERGRAVYDGSLTEALAMNEGPVRDFFDTKYTAGNTGTQKKQPLFTFEGYNLWP
ncbi:ABC transporter ATP-binding protein [Chitinivibrio alkaliphilus]|uniref:ABC transporter, ATP-binding protein n=1 Tax=Chitinivibrio alkaliphilus ACht1 TaxID=1313304 RepID=U7D4P3_9BACT|nr:ATP-binding cassette domain-containing protein [Chitinivibrio alkaliphilus]ERP31484.1 ABC transporter, ATP-binding protein [Chitinivibrio alkaliphilus ACht1]